MLGGSFQAEFGARLPFADFAAAGDPEEVVSHQDGCPEHAHLSRENQTRFECGNHRWIGQQEDDSMLGGYSQRDARQSGRRRMHSELSYGEATRLLAGLAHIVCSTAWLEKIAPQPRHKGWSFNEDQYPPGGTKTQMQFCSVCETICPPNGTSKFCCDCETERSELIFLQRCRRWAPDDRQELTRRW